MGPKSSALGRRRLASTLLDRNQNEGEGYNRGMSVQELEKAVTQLPTPELAQFTAWFEAYQADLWDQQIEEDLEAGRLDALLAEVDQEYEAGLARPL